MEQRVNGTNFDPCVACLLDALVKLDSGALLVNVTLDFSTSLEHLVFLNNNWMHNK